MTADAAVLKFSPPSASTNVDQLSILELNRHRSITSLTTPFNPEDPIFNPLPFFSPSAFPIINRSHLSSPTVPRSLSPQLQSAHPQAIQFFLKFHHSKISEAHYFRWYDYPRLCTKIIFSMAEKSDSLRYSIVAFSALIYSYKCHFEARQLGLLYYEMALRELRIFLNTPSMEMDECLVALATALQLSSFEVPS